jgi:hypothetical protein
MTPAVLLITCALSQAPVHRLSFDVISEQTFTSGEPIVVQLVIPNDLGIPVVVDLGVNYVGNLRASVLKPTGEIVEMRLGYNPREPLRLPGEVTLTPGQAHKQPVLLNGPFELTDVGYYHVVIEAVPGLSDNPRTTALLVGRAEARFVLLKRDPAVIRERADAIARQIEQATTAEAALKAAAVLVTIRDPVAVPALQQALASTWAIEPMVIRALEEIGDQTALAVLERAARDPRPLVRELAAPAAARLRAKIKQEAA